jgi:hypothetical protein
LALFGSTEKSRLRLLDHRRADPSSLSVRLRHVAGFVLIGLYTGTRAGATAASSPACPVGFDGKPAVSVKKGFQIPVRLPARPAPQDLRHVATTWLKSVPRWEATRFLGMSPEFLGDTTSVTTGTIWKGRRREQAKSRHISAA